MTMISYLDLVTIFSVLVALVAVLRFPSTGTGLRFVVVGLLLSKLVYAGLLYAKYAYASTEFEVIEDFIGAIIPMWWAFLFYVLFQQVNIKSLRKSDKSYREIFNATGDAIFIHDAANGCIIDVNQPMLDLYGYKYEEIVGADFTKVSTDDSEFSYDRAMKKIRQAAAGERLVFEWLAQKSNGERFWVEVILSDSRIDSKGRVIAVVRDISLRKEIESQREKLLKELAQKNDELESILYVSSHDLKSPLVNIQGFGGELEISFKELLRLLHSQEDLSLVKDELESCIKNDMAQAIQFIEASSEKLYQLIDGLLRVSRISKTSSTLSDTNMNKLLSVVADAMAYQLQDSGAELEISDLANCRCDEVQMNQVFTNLINNAIKYRSPDRALKITVTSKVMDSTVTYCVKDNGIGINPSHHHKIFELFHRLDPDGEIAGDGLGLTIVKRIVVRHGGNIWVESDSGEGSRFYVSLPR